MLWPMRARTLLAATLVVGTGAGLGLAACGSFGAADQGSSSSSSDASFDDVSIDTQLDGAGEHDAGRDAADGCPPPSPACEGGETISCRGLDDRCFFYCP